MLHQQAAPMMMALMMRRWSADDYEHAAASAQLDLDGGSDHVAITQHERGGGVRHRVQRADR